MEEYQVVTIGPTETCNNLENLICNSIDNQSSYITAFNIRPSHETFDLCVGSLCNDLARCIVLFCKETTVYKSLSEIVIPIHNRDNIVVRISVVPNDSYCEFSHILMHIKMWVYCRPGSFISDDIRAMCENYGVKDVLSFDGLIHELRGLILYFRKNK